MTRRIIGPHKTNRQEIEPGTRFGRWMTIAKIDWENPTGSQAKKYYRVWCVCECGEEARVKLNHLRTGASGGCIKCNPGRLTHGLAHSRSYSIWKGMKRRCGQTGNRPHKNYAGRGITVCERWLDFENFFADVGEAPVGKSLDRIDVNKGYEPENCRWATQTEQMNNMRRNRYLTWDGETMTLSQWARFFDISPHIFRNRIELGWEFERAVVTPVAKYRKSPRLNFPEKVG